MYSSLILSTFFLRFYFQLQYSCIFHWKAVLDCRDARLQKELHLRLKRLEILNIQPSFVVSSFLRSNHFFVAVAGQIPATTSTGFRLKVCLEQAISRLQVTPLSRKFEISMVEGILRRELKNVCLAVRSFNLHHSNFARWF